VRGTEFLYRAPEKIDLGLLQHATDVDHFEFLKICILNCLSIESASAIQILEAKSSVNLGCLFSKARKSELRQASCPLMA
jgi:hypothetical protein